MPFFPQVLHDLIIFYRFIVSQVAKSLSLCC